MLPPLPLPDVMLEPIVRLALQEDLGAAGDVTTDALIDPNARGRWALRARKDGVIAGLDAAGLTAWIVDPDILFKNSRGDGARVKAGETILEIEGFARSVLIAERTMLNFVGQLSGVATLTARYVEVVAGTNAKIVCTRKTTPGLRALEKRAVRLGGGGPHRYGLNDAILIKDNHIAAAGSIVEAVKAAKAANTGLEVQVEVDGIEQIEPALMAGADRLLCDNMSPAKLKEAVALVGGRVPIEASGGVRLDTIREIASTGVDFVSVGRITQSAPAADIGLDYALSP